MKTSKYIKSLSIVIVPVILFSCSQEEEQKKEPLSFTYETVERYHPNCKDENPDNGCIELTYTFPSFSGAGELPVKDTLRQATIDFIFDSTEKALSKASFDALASNWFSLYDSTQAAMPDYKLPWEQKLRVRLIHQTPAYLSAEFAEYEFSGGPHGNEIKLYRMYSIPSGEKLVLSDLLKEDKRDQLGVIAESAFREVKKLPDAAEYDERNYYFKEGMFALNKNFALTEKGLLFHYNPYDIAPYSEGPTKLLLPYEQIDSLLTDRFKPSFSVNN